MEDQLSSHASLAVDLSQQYWDGLGIFVEAKFQFHKLSKTKILEIIKTPTKGVNWITRMESLTKLIYKYDAVAEMIAKGLATGKSQAEIVKIIKPMVSNIEVSARRLVRTETIRVANMIQDESFREAEKFGLIKGYVYTATLDNRVRPEHLALHGTVFPDLESRIPVPNGPNCRCWYEPLL